MEDENQRSGKRYEILVLKVNRNNEGAVRELLALEDYFKKKGNSYSVLQASYGSPSKALKKIIAWYLDSYSLAHPRKTLYEINKMFIERKVVGSTDVGDMGVQADVEKLVGIIAGFFGKTPKKAEELEDTEESL
jgi:D-mannonate dehydratase